MGQDLDQNGNPVGESTHEGRPDTAFEKARKHWKMFWGRLLKTGSYYIIEDPDEIQDLTHNLDGNTFYRDITGQIRNPPLVESATLFAKSRTIPSKRVMKAVAVSDRDPFPVVLYSVNNIIVLTVTTGAPGVPVFATATSTLTKTATIKADSTNTVPLYVRGDGGLANSTTKAGLQMNPGDVQVFPVKDLATISISGAAATQVLQVAYIPDLDIATKA